MYKMLDLFSGVGGFSYGFEMTKQFKTILAVDMWDTALETYKKNHNGTETLLSDIKLLDNKFWKKYKDKIDVILAGPPCQGFSMSGKRDVLDPRNNLFKEVMRVVKVIEPKIVIIENVVGLLSMTDPEGSEVKELILSDFEKLGYNAKYEILNAAEYGVPQMRKRVIFIASKKDNVVYPQKTHGNSETPYITVEDAISNIKDKGETYAKPESEYQKLMQGTNKIYNHDPIDHAEKIIERMKHVPQGGNWQNIPKDLGQGGGKHSNNYRRLEFSKPAITIKHVSKSMIIHPKYHRTPTVREIARLQSFNDNFVFTGTKYDQFQQLANAVPPLLGYAIAKSVLKMLEDYND